MKMKIKDPEKLKKARNIINMLVEGINPITYESIENDSFINDPSMIRMFSYLGLVLSQDILEAEEEESGDEKDNSTLFKDNHNKVESKFDDYKNINERIKSSKIQMFNRNNFDDLKKLADHMEKNENTV